MSELVYSNVLQTGVWGLSPQPAVAMGSFCRWAIFVFWGKKLFKSHWITFRTSSQPFERITFLAFQSQSKKFSCSIFLSQLNPKTRLESCIMVYNFNCK